MDNLQQNWRGGIRLSLCEEKCGFLGRQLGFWLRGTVTKTRGFVQGCVLRHGNRVELPSCSR